MSHPFYSTSRWRRLREQQLFAEPLCRLHREVFGEIVAATVADHIVPHRGDPEAFWHGALQSLCAACHSGLKQQQERGGVMKGSRLDGSPLDPSHHWYRGE